MQSPRRFPFAPLAPCLVRHCSHVALRVSPIVRKSVGPKIKVLRIRLCWTLEELARNLRQMGMADCLEERSRGLPLQTSRSPTFRSASFLSGMTIPLSERRAGVFDLAADFLFIA
jgi:hypothetical protein